MELESLSTEQDLVHNTKEEQNGKTSISSLNCDEWDEENHSLSLWGYIFRNNIMQYTEG